MAPDSTVDRVNDHWNRSSGAGQACRRVSHLIQNGGKEMCCDCDSVLCLIISFLLSVKMSSCEEIEDGAPDLELQLPTRSKGIYLNAYDKFMHWKTQNKEDTFSENVFLNYFKDLSNKKKPSSLWSIYSMLKSTVRVKHNVYIQNYKKLTWFLKKKSFGYQCIRSRILTEENIMKFINEAPDDAYLDVKIALILGVCGACRIGEIAAITINNIKTRGDVMIVDMRNSLVKCDRMFIVRDDFVPVVQKYQALRPKNVPTDRFFLNYNQGKCTKHVIGKNKIACMPKRIASFLKLPNPERYTGHCFRRSSPNSGANFTTTNIRNNDKKTIETPSEEQMVQLAKMRRKYKKYEESTIDEDFSQEVHIKHEEAYQSRALILKDLSVMKSLQDFKPSSPETEIFADVQPESDVDIESESIQNSVHIKTEAIDETIPLQSSNDSTERSQPSNSNAVQVTKNEKETHISVAGKNISITFNKCASVGNVTINIINKE